MLASSQVVPSFDTSTRKLTDGVSRGEVTQCSSAVVRLGQYQYRLTFEPDGNTASDDPSVNR